MRAEGTALHRPQSTRGPEGLEELEEAAGSGAQHSDSRGREMKLEWKAGERDST